MTIPVIIATSRSRARADDADALELDALASERRENWGFRSLGH